MDCFSATTFWLWVWCLDVLLQEFGSGTSELLKAFTASTLQVEMSCARTNWVWFLKLCLGKQEASAPVLWYIIGRLCPTIQFVSDMPNISTSSTATSSVMCLYSASAPLEQSMRTWRVQDRVEWFEGPTWADGASGAFSVYTWIRWLSVSGVQGANLQISSNKIDVAKQRCFTLFFGRFYPDNLDSVTWNSHSLYPSNLDVVWLIVGRSQAYIYTYNSRGNFHVARLY